jgi:uncharacterized membrane protein
MPQKKGERRRPAGTKPARLITRDAQVLAYVADHPRASQKEIAAATKISARTVQRMLADLERAGYMRYERVDRRNRYDVNTDAPLGEGFPGTVRDLLALIRSP